MIWWMSGLQFVFTSLFHSLTHSFTHLLTLSLTNTALTMHIIKLFCEQVAVMTWKNLHQKRLAGRTTLKEILTPMGLIGFWIYIMIMASMPMKYPDAVYTTRDLPPLSSKGLWGIFRPDEDDNAVQFPDVIDSRRLYYSPNTHQGVNELVSVPSHSLPH